MNKKSLYVTLKAAALVAAVFICGCGSSVNDSRLPDAPVSIVFPTQADWNTHGTPAPLSHRSFIKRLRQPSSFPFTATTETGFGGVLLVADVFGAPAAFCLACPVEKDAGILVEIDEEQLIARCPKCGSTFDVFSNNGIPLSGPAASKKYALRRHYVGAGLPGQYMIIRNTGF